MTESLQPCLLVWRITIYSNAISDQYFTLDTSHQNKSEAIRPGFGPWSKNMNNLDIILIRMNFNTNFIYCN